MSTDLYFYFSLLFLVASIGMIRFQRLSVPFKILAVSQTVVLASEIIARVLAICWHNSYPTYHFFCIIQYWFYATIYRQLLQGSYSVIVWNSATVFTVIWLVNSLYFQTLFTFPSNTIMLSFILQVGFSLVLFMQMLKRPEQIAISRQSVFWFNCAVLIYSTAIPVCFGLLNFLIKHHFKTGFLQNFIEWSAFLYYSLVGISLWIDSFKRDTSYV